ncbi:MAG: molybdopterin-dependent oxidoreductase [Syntrophales bacterium]|nr:molybdopterin-dependent oxidoreductase [Syntrophales bacterium]
MESTIKWKKTHCARMDHGGCGLLVGVQGNRILKIKGDPEGFLNRGFICPKGALSAERLYHPERLRYPLKRVGERGSGQWVRISWEEALNFIAENLNRLRDTYGARAVAFGVGMPKGLDHFLQIRLANVFGSPNVVASQDVCHAPREITGVHSCGFYPVVDLHNESALIILWGSNITATNEEGEINSLLREQLKKGTELIVVDPRKIDLCQKARMWLRIRPGTDVALALSMINVIIEEELYDSSFVKEWTVGFSELAQHVKDYTPEKVASITWLSAEEIRTAAHYYAKAKPAAIQWGNPIEHNIHAFQTVRALICLMAITGNLDVPGGNVEAHDPKIMRLSEFVRADLIPNKRTEMISAHYRVIPRFMTIPPAYFRRAVLNGIPYPVRGFFAICCNPMLSWANSRLTYETLISLDFFAISDMFMTPTTALADVVLPAASHFEFDDIGHYGLGHGYILARPKIVDPPDECWPDMKIITELGKRVSPPELWPEDWHDFLEALLAPSGLSYAQFAEKGYLKGPDRFRGYERDGFKTPTKKVELKLSTADKLGLPPLPSFDTIPEAEDEEYPLILTSAKNRIYLHSSYRWVEKLRRLAPHPQVEIHPQTAASLNIEEGDETVIETRYGRIIQKAHLNPDLHPRVICAEHGWWFPEESSASLYGWEKSNLNMLTSVEKLGREYGTPNIRALPCKIKKSM